MASRGDVLALTSASAVMSWSCDRGTAKPRLWFSITRTPVIETRFSAAHYYLGLLEQYSKLSLAVSGFNDSIFRGATSVGTHYTHIYRQ